MGQTMFGWNFADDGGQWDRASERVRNKYRADAYLYIKFIHERSSPEALASYLWYWNGGRDYPLDGQHSSMRQLYLDRAQALINAYNIYSD